MSHIGARNSVVSGGGRYFHFTRTNSQSQSAGAYHPSADDFIKSFYAVLRRWESETAFISDPNKIISHPSYTALVANAEIVISLIIDELKIRPSLLVWVLEDAFKVAPYPPEAIGDIEQMTNGWLLWAKQHERSA